MKFRSFIVAAAALLCANPVSAGQLARDLPHAANSKTKPSKPAPVVGEAPMRVVVVRSSKPGCEPNCPEWIAAQGAIDAGATAQFKKVLKSIGDKKLAVLIDSAGGSVDEGFAIGRLIRSKGLDVAVTRTIVVPCGKNDPDCTAKGTTPVGRPVGPGSKCASSCAFVLAAGVHRYAAPTTFVGVHQFKTIATKVLQTYRIQTRHVLGSPVEVKRTLVSEKVVGKVAVDAGPRDKSYAAARRYFTQMGIGDDVMKMIMATPNSQIHRLTGPELKNTRLATDFIDGDKLLEMAAAAPVAPASEQAATPATASAPVQ
jgi:hypothetical protein